jgi:hypothetical protein
MDRSYLFAPGHNANILEKVFDAGADAAILDSRTPSRRTPRTPRERINAARSREAAEDLACPQGNSSTGPSPTGHATSSSWPAPLRTKGSRLLWRQSFSENHQTPSDSGRAYRCSSSRGCVTSLTHANPLTAWGHPSVVPANSATCSNSAEVRPSASPRRACECTAPYESAPIASARWTSLLVRPSSGPALLRAAPSA